MKYDTIGLEKHSALGTVDSQLMDSEIVKPEIFIVEKVKFKGYPDGTM